MPTLVSAHQISKSFAAKTLFKDISFAVDSSERIGLIGPNGAGKSTLLSLIAGQQKADKGSLSFSNNLRLAYLEQTPKLNPDLSVYDTLMSATDDPYDSNNIQLAFELISKLELDSLEGGSEKKAGELSGGWNKKVALAKELMTRPNLLLLDEPTNHLDLESILWLEEFLNKSRDMAVLTVTHDRRFLQNVCSVIFDLNPQLPNGLLRTSGSYSAHLESKMMLLEGQKRLEEKRRNTMLQEKEWLARGPQARLTKQKARIERAYDLIDEVKNLENKNYKRALDLDFGNNAKSPQKLIEAKHIEKKFADHLLFTNFNALIRPGHRYGLIGPNGAGKSTLLKCLTGRLAPDRGEIKINDDIEISYFEQGKDQIDLNQTVLRCICPEGDYVHFQDQPVFARSYLSRFYFNAQQAEMPARQLSGGELSRLILAKLMLKKAHVLVLDEPTNDLDVETLEALADCLREFNGAVILVSHDRYFMDQNCDVIWAMDSSTKEIITFADTYQWEDWFNNKNKKQPQQKTENKKEDQKKTGGKSGLSNKEKIEFEKIEAKIAEEEALLQQLQSTLSSPESQSNFQKLADLTNTIAGTEKQIETLFARWEYLTEKNKS
jgi:ATP-binding cassette subfamily F protein uup